MSSGSFEDPSGNEVQWELLEVHDYDGEVYTGGEMDEHLHEADRAFYVLTTGAGEFHRWVAGPFESIGDLESAISDEVDFYNSIDTA